MSNTPIYDNMSTPEPDNTPQPSGAPQPKVVAATVGAGVGSALATVAVWVIGLTSGVAVPEGVELALGVILSGVLAFGAGYWKRNER